MLGPFRISVFDKAFAPLDWVGAPLEQHYIIRDAQASTGSFVLDSDDEQIGVLTAPGARVVVEYFADPTTPTTPTFLMSGIVADRTGVGGAQGTRTFTILDDWSLVLGVLGWQVPAGAISAQDPDYDWSMTGPAETVAKALIGANATRLGLPVTIATDLGRGATITITSRMHQLVDRLYPAITQAGIGISVRQSGAGLVVDCYEPTVLTDTLTEASGVVAGGTWTQHPPTVTRVVVAGGGEGTARVYRLVVNTAVETAWGIKLEASRDARDTTDTAIMDARGWETLNAGAPTSGVSCELAETEDFRFVVTFGVGDSVPIQLAGAPVITDTVTEVELALTPADGLVVTPRVGDAATTFESMVSAAVTQIATRQRDQDMRS